LGVLTAVDELRKLGWEIGEEQLRYGLAYVEGNTGLQGRWQTLSTDPFIICDTGHNEDGIREVMENIQATVHNNLHVVIGAMRDKDLSHMLPQLPKEAVYYFCSPDMPRALPAMELKDKANQYELKGQAYSSIATALTSAKQAYADGDLIFVGGSNFVVADVLKDYKSPPLFFVCLHCRRIILSRDTRTFVISHNTLTILIAIYLNQYANGRKDQWAKDKPEHTEEV